MNEQKISAETAVIGIFEDVEIIFSIADCKRVEDCIKVHNVKKIDEEHPAPVPAVLCLTDKRLVLNSVTKEQIRAYFIISQQTDHKISSVAEQKKQKNAPKKQQKYANFKR